MGVGGSRRESAMLEKYRTAPGKVLLAEVGENMASRMA